MTELSIQIVFLARMRELQSSGRAGEESGRARSKRLDHKATGARRPGQKEHGDKLGEERWCYLR